MKALTIPRLELLAAQLLAILMKRIVGTTYVDLNELYYFSNSRIVMSWLKMPMERLKLYVSNRVIKIRDISNTSRWFHVTTNNNPADMDTRGISVHSFF